MKSAVDLLGVLSACRAADEAGRALLCALSGANDHRFYISGVADFSPGGIPVQPGPKLPLLISPGNFQPLLQRAFSRNQTTRITKHDRISELRLKKVSVSIVNIQTFRALNLSQRMTPALPLYTVNQVNALSGFVITALFGLV